MRKSIFLLVASFILLGCQKDDNTISPPTGSGSLSCSVNGQFWGANQELTASKGTTLTINAKNINGSSLSLILTDLDTGVYIISADRNKAIFSESASSFLSTNSNPGSLSITQHDTIKGNIKGSFQFAGRNAVGATRTITQGSFDLLYSR
jgi:hypothetical protein